MFKHKESIFCFFLLVVALNISECYSTSYVHTIHDKPNKDKLHKEEPRNLGKDPSCTIDKPYRWATDHQCHKNPLIADEGCPEEAKPFKCGNGMCYKTHSECKSLINKCADMDYPFSCWTGACTKSPYECQELAQEKNLSKKCKNSKHIKCEDGWCRSDCKKLKSSRCPLSQPWNCGNGSCKSQKGYCTTENYCDPNAPYMCPDMSCAKDLSDCNFSFAFGVFDNQIMWKYDLGTDKKRKPDSMTYYAQTALKDFNMFLFDIEGTGEIFQPHPMFSPYQKFNKKKHEFESEI